MKYYLFTLILLSCLVCPAYCPGVDLADFPSQLVNVLNINLFSAQILASTLLLAIFLIPTVFACSKFKKDIGIPALLVGFSVLTFCVAMTWFPVWILIIMALLIATFFGKTITEAF